MLAAVKGAIRIYCSWKVPRGCTDKGIPVHSIYENGLCSCGLDSHKQVSILCLSRNVVQEDCEAQAIAVVMVLRHLKAQALPAQLCLHNHIKHGGGCCLD